MFRHCLTHDIFITMISSCPSSVEIPFGFWGSGCTRKGSEANKTVAKFPPATNCGRGLGVWSLGFEACCFRCWVCGLGFGILGLELGVEGLEFRV